MEKSKKGELGEFQPWIIFKLSFDLMNYGLFFHWVLFFLQLRIRKSRNQSVAAKMKRLQSTGFPVHHAYAVVLYLTADAVQCYCTSLV